MKDFSLTDRQVKLLLLVREGAGTWDARRIDIKASVRYGAGQMTVLRELEDLQSLGMVRRDDSRSGVGGRWTATAAAQLYLSGLSDDQLERARRLGLGRGGVAGETAEPAPEFNEDARQVNCQHVDVRLGGGVNQWGRSTTAISAGVMMLSEESLGGRSEYRGRNHRRP